jgi:hypothetical protein
MYLYQGTKVLKESADALVNTNSDPGEEISRPRRILALRSGPHVPECHMPATNL